MGVWFGPERARDLKLSRHPRASSSFPMNFASAVARRLVTFSCLLLVVVSASGAERVKSPSPAESLQAFRVAPGLRVELVAAEPEVVDPVAIAFDELRRLYVVENRGYPDPMDGKSAPPIGRVALAPLAVHGADHVEVGRLRRDDVVEPAPGAGALPATAAARSA